MPRSASYSPNRSEIPGGNDFLADGQAVRHGKPKLPVKQSQESRGAARTLAPPDFHVDQFFADRCHDGILRNREPAGAPGAKFSRSTNLSGRGQSPGFSASSRSVKVRDADRRGAGVSLTVAKTVFPRSRMVAFTRAPERRTGYLLQTRSRK